MRAASYSSSSEHFTMRACRQVVSLALTYNQSVTCSLTSYELTYLPACLPACLPTYLPTYQPPTYLILLIVIRLGTDTHKLLKYKTSVSRCPAGFLAREASLDTSAMRATPLPAKPFGQGWSGAWPSVRLHSLRLRFRCGAFRHLP